MDVIIIQSIARSAFIAMTSHRQLAETSGVPQKYTDSALNSYVQYTTSLLN